MCEPDKSDARLPFRRLRGETGKTLAFVIPSGGLCKRTADSWRHRLPREHSVHLESNQNCIERPKGDQGSELSSLRVLRDLQALCCPAA